MKQTKVIILVLLASSYFFTLSGEIRIDFILENSRYLLIYQDNGPGIPDIGNLEKPETLGMQLIRGLVGQLDGTVRYDTHQGFRCIIDFPA